MLQNKDFKAMLKKQYQVKIHWEKMKSEKKKLHAHIDPLCAAAYLGKTVQTNC